MNGNITIKDKKKGERVVKRLLKKQTMAKVDKETGIPGAGKQIEALQKEVAALKRANTSLTMTVGKLWKWKCDTREKG